MQTRNLTKNTCATLYLRVGEPGQKSTHIQKSTHVCVCVCVGVCVCVSCKHFRVWTILETPYSINRSVSLMYFSLWEC